VNFRPITDSVANSAFPVVFKIGGSLLDRTHLLSRTLFERIDEESRHCPVIVLFGGGREVDKLREEYRSGQLTDDQAHWQAVNIMDRHAEKFSPMILNHAPVLDFRSIQETSHQPVIAVKVGAALRDDPALPVGWHITSDSIAGWVAQKVHARRLVLAKSVGQSGSYDPAQSQRLGWVDEYFPTIARYLIDSGCALEWINAAQVSDTTE
jgi:aspartokinase-like uncharacterized kinase